MTKLVFHTISFGERYLVATFCLYAVTVFILCSFLEAAEEHNGIGIFIESCRNVGTNLTLIKSLYAEYEKTYYEDETLHPKRSQIQSNLESTAQKDTKVKDQIIDRKSQHSLLLKIQNTVRHKK